MDAWMPLEFLVVGSILCSVGLLLIAWWAHYTEVRNRLAELEERRRIQMAEWNEQLERYPWLRQVIEGPRFMDRLDPRVAPEVRLVRVGDRVMVEPVYEEKVEWKKEGF